MSEAPWSDYQIPVESCDRVEPGEAYVRSGARLYRWNMGTGDLRELHGTEKECAIRWTLRQGGK